MKKKQLMKMDIQMFAQTWNPDNVTVLEKKDGTIPDKYNTLILKDVMENSKLMQLAKYEEMDGKEKKFEYFAEGPGAYWVGEGEKIKTSKPKWLNVTMTAKKIGVIIPVSREYLTYKMSDFFTQMQPKIAEAFYKKIDAATILDKENPFSQSIEKSVIAASNVIEGDLTYDNILALEDLLGEGEYDPNAFNKLPSEMNSIGANAIDGLTNGINANANSALAAARGVADQIVSTMKSAMDIHSPSRVMRDEVGKMIPAGVAVGIDKYSNFVEKSMQRLSKKVDMPALDNLNSNLSFSGGSQSLAFAGDVSSKFTVEVPVIFDSSEVARVIAKPMSKELQNQQDKKNVSLGRRR
ncbi:phage major capsid protein [Enterococcus faecalis]|nr:phage major capsid protein [Enterococcus faecalis]